MSLKYHLSVVGVTTENPKPTLAMIPIPLNKSRKTMRTKTKVVSNGNSRTKILIF